MNLSSDKVTEIFYLIDEFCIQFDATLSTHIVGNVPKKKPTSCSEKDRLLKLLTMNSKYVTGRIFQAQIFRKIYD